MGGEVPTVPAIPAALGGDYARVVGYLSGWRSQVPMRICQTEEGVWTLSPVGRMSSTPHAYAVAQWHSDGHVGGLFADPGWRDASDEWDWIVPGRGWVENGQAVCERSDGKYGSPHRMWLPGGRVLFDLTFPTEAAAPGISAPPVDPQPAVPAPAPPVSGATGDGPEVVAWERPGKFVALWAGRARVLGWPADDGRTIVVFDQEGDPE